MDNTNEKKEYHKPVLLEHGDIKDITRGRKCCPPDPSGSGGEDDPS